MKDREALSFKILQAAQRSHSFQSAKFVGGKVTIDDKAYAYEDFDYLPEELLPTNLYSLRTGAVIVFIPNTASSVIIILHASSWMG